jgi:hypothetical protein
MYGRNSPVAAGLYGGNLKLFFTAECEDRELLLYDALQFCIQIHLPTYTASHLRIL